MGLIPDGGHMPMKKVVLLTAGLVLMGVAGVVTTQAVLSVTPTALTFTSATTQTVTVRNAGRGSLKWMVVQSSDAWLTVSPVVGTNTGTLTVRVASDLAAGSYATFFAVRNTRDGALVQVDVSVTIASAPPPPPTSDAEYGPRATILCPADAVAVPLGTSLQAAIDANPGGTTFCVRTGTHALTSSIRPKTGDTFVGEYGAILDGSTWATSDTTAAAFRAHNEDIDDVTIRNLVIRNMPQSGIRGFKDFSDRWTIDYTDIIDNRGTGLHVPTDSQVLHSRILRNAVGGYAAYLSNRVVFEGNEIAQNGAEHKITLNVGTIFRNNFVHHNVNNGIWYDGENTQSLIEGNRVEDNPGEGIFYEVSGQGIIRNNTIRRNGDNAIFISTSHNTEVHSNVMEDNFRGVNIFVDCTRVGSPDGGYIGERFYASDVTVYNNTVTVGTQSGALANGLGYTGCTDAQLQPYLDGSMRLIFRANTYAVPVLNGRWFAAGRTQSWAEWLARPQDVGSVLNGPTTDNSRTASPWIVR